MKRVLSIVIVIIIFLVGIKIGSNSSYTETNDLFENAKEQFEQEIVIPNNEYQNIDLKPKEYLPNKIAKMISELIDKFVSKLV